MAKADVLIDIHMSKNELKGKKNDYKDNVKLAKPGKGAGKVDKKKHSKGD